MAPSKILAIKLRALGDTVLMTAPVIELTRAFPHSEIHLAVTDTWAPLVKGIPGIKKIWPCPYPNNRITRSFSMAHLAFQFRQEKYDCVVNFHASPSTSRLAFVTGARLRSIHFHGHRDKNQYSTVTIPGKGTLKPIIERDMDTIRGLGIHVPAGRSPQLFPHFADIQDAQRQLQHLGLQGPILGLSLGSSRPTKSWPIERFASLALEWIQKEKAGVLAIAGPTEGSLIHQFLKAFDDLLGSTSHNAQTRAQIRRSVATLNQLPLKSLPAMLSQISVLAGNDSGPKHVAIAVDTPTVTLFGPEDPFEWHPYPTELHPYCFIKDLPCRKDADPGMPAWCGIQKCIIEEHQCMRLIGIDAVLAHCQRVAKRKK